MAAPWSHQPAGSRARARTTGRGRKPPFRPGRRARRGRDSCRTSVWGAGSSAQPRRGLLPLLSDLSGLPRCEGASGLFPPSCGEPTCPAPPLISAPAARRRPAGRARTTFRGGGPGVAGDPALRSRSPGGSGLPPVPRPGAARGAASCSSLPPARAGPAAAGGSASEAKLLVGSGAVGTRGRDTADVKAGLLPASPSRRGQARYSLGPAPAKVPGPRCLREELPR